MNDEPGIQQSPLPAPAGPPWFQRVSSFLFVLFCAELGLFLVVYPWTDAWTSNYFSIAAPDRVLTTWREIWNNSYVRGAVSGIGLVNVWIAIGEVFRLFSKWKR